MVREVLTSLPTLTNSSFTPYPNTSDVITVLENQVILSDLLQITVVLDFDVRRDFIQLSLFGKFIDSVPIFLRIPFNGFLAKLPWAFDPCVLL